jgi:hypothetical protein
MAHLARERHRPSSPSHGAYTDPNTENKSSKYVSSNTAHSSLTNTQLNASDDRGIDVVREQIKQFAETRTLFSKGYKLIVLDEADMMTQQAQAALRRVIEQYTRNVRFCIICNYVNKIAPAIQSRCTRFRFSPLPIEQVEMRLEHVIDAERWVVSRIYGVSVYDDAVSQGKYYGGWEAGVVEAFERRYAPRTERLAGLPCGIRHHD